MSYIIVNFKLSQLKEVTQKQIAQSHDSQSHASHPEPIFAIGTWAASLMNVRNSRPLTKKPQTRTLVTTRVMNKQWNTDVSGISNKFRAHTGEPSFNRQFGFQANTSQGSYVTATCANKVWLSGSWGCWNWNWRRRFPLLMQAKTSGFRDAAENNFSLYRAALFFSREI